LADALLDYEGHCVRCGDFNDQANHLITKKYGQTGLGMYGYTFASSQLQAFGELF
jgi:hypothetical protein